MTTAALTTILGAVMLASSLAVKLVGLPRQAVANYRRKSAPHAMKWFSVLGLVSYSSQALWTALHGDWLLCAAQAPGVVVLAVCLWQVLRYPDAG